uniref:Non-specific lipid-transfer protein-like protein n=1 Tax=Tamarix hispida TaxID=189793 RepID=C0KHK0_9CARY|nr:non-specific lipid-transfer protein-like protein [Tamarix hispida]
MGRHHHLPGTMLMAILVLATMVTVEVRGQDGGSVVGAPGPAVDSGGANHCITALTNMSDCLSYAEKGSNLTKPDKPCCPELAGLVDSNPICLCELLGKGSSYGLQIDLNRALKLPETCKVDTPPISMCSTVGIPVGAPTLSTEGPTGAMSESSAPGMSPTGGIAASPTSSKNGASINARCGLMTFVGFGMALLLAS